MRIPDWIIYLLALGVILFTLLPGGDDAMAPEAPPPEFPASGEARPLPPPSAFDERVLVQVDKPMSGTGTAFALNNRGEWVTARHVVDGCSEIALEIQPGTLVPVVRSRVSEETDLALLRTGTSPIGLPVDIPDRLTIGIEGYHIGYPQGRPGEATSKLLSRSKLISRGERSNEEEVLTWAEQGRTRGLDGSLGGMSGGPVFDSNGNVIAVTIAESPRRGRIYTTTPGAFAKFLSDERVSVDATEEARPITTDDYGRAADRIRRSHGVVKVVCRVEE